MDAFIRFTNQTQGRDRLFRATQYTCMLLRYLLEPKAGKEKVVMKLKKLESSVSTGRKWFRLGNVVHAVQSTEQSIHATDPVPRLCLTLANLNRVVYFICDTILWVRSVGLTMSINKEKWQTWATRHYYYFLLLSLVRDLYEISLQMGRLAHDRAMREKSSQNPFGYSLADEETEWLQSFLLLLFRSLKQHPPLLLDTVKNLCDILIPLDQMGIYRSNPGIIGLGGLVSSVAGIITVAYPQMKLKIL
ncbi:peroxisomal membrane protein 11A isoform X1 [Marmota monax]|uniref:Peroxisomal biosis factor 11 alpha n=3 Tax=Marmota TaxID=9992 RepID=A0A8C6A1A3_MARMA|nr:peroxisomal membrane protein 11A isoform X1 [Marmota marmota marmota]XP_046293361.1 peroxisomal membrane protein 11A isoform X1 [Marmota monax]KAI6056839.1 PEX11A [Marmota monax]KAI6070593.1 PEX11A [Marmota monax]